jgi:AcrR family transcriptional regulator
VSEPAPARRIGRPPRLSREAVIDAAEAIIERDGIDALTMRRLAEELESAPMALYRHVRDKDELLVLLLDRRAAELPRPALPEDPRARLLTLFRLLYDGLSESPWIVQVLVKGDLVAPSVLWAVDAIVAAFRAAGLGPDRAAAAYHVAWRYTVGELIVRHESARHLGELEREPMVSSIVAELGPEELPALAAIGREMAAAREGLSYNQGLAAVIDGLLAWGGRPPS